MHQYKFCICGGGALGHVMACMISSKGFEVNLLTMVSLQENRMSLFPIPAIPVRVVLNFIFIRK